MEKIIEENNILSHDFVDYIGVRKLKETRWKCNNLADVSLQVYYLPIINACYMHKYAIETTITDVTFLLPRGFSCSTSRIGHVKNYKLY